MPNWILGHTVALFDMGLRCRYGHGMKKPKAMKSLRVEAAKAVESRREAFRSLKSKLKRAAAEAERGELLPGEHIVAELREHSARRRIDQS
ncbi:MAG: hypothetical protein ABSH22_20355 [Tepidisphaeraceae bacterium]|jgi:hypothetical protein